MLSDDDKKWIAAQISAQIALSEDGMGARIVAYESRFAARLEKFKATLIAEFHKWALSPSSDLRIDAAAMRTMDLELEALQGRVDKRNERHRVKVANAMLDQGLV